MLGTLFLFLMVILLLLAVIFFFTSQQSVENKKITEETNNWEDQKEQFKKESKAEKNKEWFSPQRWLSDQEIDWVCQRKKSSPMPGSFPGQELEKFKVLPAHQFHYVREINYSWFSKQDNYIQESFSKLSQTKGTIEANAHLAFPELLQALTSFSGELVFIPVNNPDFHWSLLVYESKSKKFYHYDTLKGANYGYAKPLVKELLQQIHQTNYPNLKQYLVKRHEIKQGNGWDCGVAVIAIIKKITEKYQGEMENIDLGEFDFKKQREELRKKYLTEHE